MIIRQTTTIVFEYPQDYLQEQEWCKTKEDRWIHKGTDTLGAVYENTISYSIGQPNNSEKPNNCEYAENPSGDVWECGCFLDTYCEHQIYDRNPDGTINIVECGYEPTISKMEQVDKDINVRSKDEPQMERKDNE